MKKGILVFGFILLIQYAKSQVIDTTVTFITACKIQSVKVKITDTTSSVKIGIRSLGDNFETNANLYVCFMDQKNNITNEFTYLLSGNEYKNWDGTSNYLFNLFSSKYSLVFIKP
jgi:hypothetical protein